MASANATTTMKATKKRSTLLRRQADTERLRKFWMLLPAGDSSPEQGGSISPPTNSSPEKTSDRDLPWKLRPRKPFHKEDPGSEPEYCRSAKNCEKVKLWNKTELGNTNESFSIALSTEEIVADLLKMTETKKPPKRPKKRSKKLQSQFDQMSPGMWLSQTTTPDLYKVELYKKFLGET